MRHDFWLDLLIAVASVAAVLLGGFVLAEAVLAADAAVETTEATIAASKAVMDRLDIPSAAPVAVADPVPDPVDETDAQALARAVWGEARGCSRTEQAAVVWCAINRLESADPYYAGCESLRDIVLQPGQFCGYDRDNPLDPDILALVEDVLARWEIEDICVGSVGRVLPEEYLFFTGDGAHNHFTTQWNGGTVWDWSLDSPYGED